MPTPRTWLPRIEEILEILKKSDQELLDRGAIEALFQLQRRTSLLLMKEVGVVERGVQHFVNRKALIAWVERLKETEWQGLQERRQTIEHLVHDVQEMEALRAVGTPTRFQIVRDKMKARLASLPHGITLEAGRITIEYDETNPMQACELLYYLGLALDADMESFMELHPASRADGQIAV